MAEARIPPTNPMASKNGKKLSAGNNSDSANRQPPMRICSERILSDKLDQERAVRSVMRVLSLGATTGTPEQEKNQFAEKMDVINSKKWTGTTQLRRRFLDGSKAVQKKVEGVAPVREQYASIKFKFVKTGDVEIRIAFITVDVSWSAVGRVALVTQCFPKHQLTINFG